MHYNLSGYSLEIVWIRQNYGEWQATCDRCGLSVQTARIGDYTDSFHLQSVMNKHICDPTKKKEDV